MFDKFIKNNLSLLRLLSQSCFTIYCLWIGYRFYRFYLWATTGSNYVARPPAIESFLPVGALVSLKKFVLTGEFDRLHPAGLTIFISALVIALLFRKGFCGWICPVGFIFNLQEALVSRFRAPWHPPRWLDYPLSLLKYLFLFFFLYLIAWKMDLSSIERFMHSPYNLMVDAKMLLFFLTPSLTTLMVIASIILASIFLRNFWCHYLCPYGGLLGLLAILSPFQIQRDANLCTNCKKCELACPQNLLVAQKQVVLNPECVGCLECAAACPISDCLNVTLPRRKKIAIFWLPLAIILTFILFYLYALKSGHWQTAIPDELFRRLYNK
ncbi:MAG: 4Fe-4S binding protein [Pseudomonadota bacterium]|nr:4Fe-4S binding protein [Pseudomonadota bacterium]